MHETYEAMLFSYGTGSFFILECTNVLSTYTLQVFREPICTSIFSKLNKPIATWDEHCCCFFPQDVGSICEQLENLAVLNLSNNYLAPDIAQLPPLKNIHILVLNNCGMSWMQVLFFLHPSVGLKDTFCFCFKSSDYCVFGWGGWNNQAITTKSWRTSFDGKQVNDNNGVYHFICFPFRKKLYLFLSLVNLRNKLHTQNPK